MLRVKGEERGPSKGVGKNAEARRKERPSLPSSLSCYTCVFSLAELLPAPLGATWAAQRSTWRVTPVGVMMETAAFQRKNTKRWTDEWGRCCCILKGSLNSWNCLKF